MSIPTEEQIKRLGPEPENLAGFQLLCNSVIQLGDLAVDNDLNFWARYTVGKRSNDDGNCSGFRIYRRIPVAKTEGWTGPTPGTPHHSDPAPRLSETRAALPTNAADRKGIPIATGFVDYFPDAMAAVARLSAIGNEQHHPGQPLHWDKTKSTDEADALMRHFIQRGTVDSDGVLHSVKVAWRAMALAQREIEALKLAAK